MLEEVGVGRRGGCWRWLGSEKGIEERRKWSEERRMEVVEEVWEVVKRVVRVGMRIVRVVVVIVEGGWELLRIGRRIGVEVGEVIGEGRWWVEMIGG